MREHEKNTRNKRIAMSNFDIDFPVSESWAEFYAAQGLSVDPSMVVGVEWLRDEAKIRRRKPDPELLKEALRQQIKRNDNTGIAIKQNATIIKLLATIIKLLRKIAEPSTPKQSEHQEEKKQRMVVVPQWK